LGIEGSFGGSVFGGGGISRRGKVCIVIGFGS